MKIIYIKKKYLISFLFMFLFLSLLISHAFGAQWNVKCNKCGYENWQWLEEDTVHYCYNCGGLGMPVQIYDNSDREDPIDKPIDPQPPPPDEAPWAVAIGGAAALAAAAAAVAARSRKKNARKDTRNNNDQETVGYVLQLSTEYLGLKPGEGKYFTATAWEVDRSGHYKEAPYVQIRVEPPSGSAELTLSPPGGFGRIDCLVSLNDYPAEHHLELLVVAAHKGFGTSARVTLGIERTYLVVVE